MEKDKLYKLMSSSDDFTSETLMLLKELMNKHTYFQGARILYLQNLKAISSQELDAEIQQQASLLPCRHQLYRRINPAKSILHDVINNLPLAEPKKTGRAKPKAKKDISIEPSFVLLDEPNHNEIVSINIETTGNVADGDILELIEGDAPDQEKNATDNLIDAFLNNIPKIERPSMPQRGEVVDNEDISLRSIEEPEELASEPLAQIFISQGYFDKALAVYEKLCLKYPEKSSYFADQIQKVKEQINSKH